jgi:uncharacterized membrane protein required for colicin V production
MIFSIVIVLMVGVIAYFYYVQGLLTSLLTAACAVMAAVIAVSYHENLAMAAFKNKLTDEGTAFSLVLLFALTFVVLRITLDTLIPGNIRLPVLMDRIGAGVFGVIAGIFATGVFAIAAQSLPFGPSIMGQSRFKTLPPRDVHVPTAGMATDSQVYDELSSEKFTDDDRQSLWLPVDEWVLGLTSYLSDGGALEGDHTFTSVHPNYLDEMFGQRIGIQPGADHVALNYTGHDQVSVPLAYCPPELAEADAEIPQIRNGTLQLVKPTLKPDGANVILVIRVMFTVNAADSDDKLVRFSTASIRLVANGVNYYPLGTLDAAGVLRMDKPDDPLFVGVADADHAADLVFFVPKSGVLQGATVTKTASGKTVSESFGSFAPGLFLDVKRMAQVDLSDVKIFPPQAPDKTLNVLRKNGVPKPAASVAVAAPAEMGDDSPFAFDHMDVSPSLFTPIAVGLFDGDNTAVTFGSGTATVRGKKLAKLNLTATTPLASLGSGDNAFDQLFVPAGMKAVQLVGTLPPKASDPWNWAEHLGEFSVVDATGKAYKPSGALAKVMKSIQPMAVGAYDADAGVTEIPKTPDVRPTDVYLIFLVPDGVTLKELDYQGKRLTPLNKSVDG